MSNMDDRDFMHGYRSGSVGQPGRQEAPIERMWYEHGFGQFVAWLDDHTPGRLPWGHIALAPRPFRGWSFHWPSGHGGFAIGFPLPRWLPGFVRSYQVDGPRRFWRLERCPWSRESSLHVILPVIPPGLPHAYRSRRLRRRTR